MKSTREILQNNNYFPNRNVNDDINNVNNDIGNKLNNDNNVTNKYSLDKNKFKPNTEGAQLAEEIATKLNDLDNFACYFSVVNRIGVLKAKTILSQTLADIKEKAETKYPVRSHARYFMWKVNSGH